MTATQREKVVYRYEFRTDEGRRMTSGSPTDSRWMRLALAEALRRERLAAIVEARRAFRE